MSMTIPTIPVMPAGYIATAGDLNNLAYAAQFMLTKPIVRVHDTAGGLAITTGGVNILYGAADYDPDGMWSVANNTRLTIQTPGYYRLDYFVSLNTAGTTINVNSIASVTTGPGNPAGSGVNTQCYAGYGSGSATTGNRVGCRAAGVIPFYLYAGDFVIVEAVAASAGLSTSVSGFVPSFLALEYVSI